jgi:hypothetical protein
MPGGEARALPSRWLLLDPFLLGVDSRRSGDNTLLLYQAMQVFHGPRSSSAFEDEEFFLR